MSGEKIVFFASLAVVAVVILVSGIIFVVKLRRRHHKADYFAVAWKELQSRCSDKKQWPDILAEADKLLDEALKKRRIKGKSMGARLVAAQKLFTDNDGVWFGHKLRTKYENDKRVSLTKTNMKQALTGLRQGLKDLGVL
jgi:hypothetical protein